MTPEIVTLCHSAVAHGNKLCVLDAFNIIYADKFPHRFPPFTLALRLRFEADDNETHKLKATVADIDGRILGEMIVSIPLPKESLHRPKTLCITFPISGMELRCSGEHTIDLILDDNPAVSTPFYVYEKP